MKKSHVVVLAICFVLLVALYFFMQQPRHVDVSSLYVDVTPKININDIASIRAVVQNAPETELYIKKANNNWQIETKKDGETLFAPAKESKVMRLINDLSELTGELRAAGKDILKDFGLEENKGLKIVVSSKSGSILEIYVGKKGPRWGSSFVRLKDSDKVYLVSKDILVDFDIWSNKSNKNIDIQPWIDLQVIKENSFDIKRCSYSGSSFNWSLYQKNTADEKKEGEKKEKDIKRDKKEWFFEKNGKSVKKSADDVKKFLSKLFPLYAKDIVSPKKAKTYNLDSEKKTEKFVYEKLDGLKKEILLGKCNKTRCFIKDDRGFIFEIEKSWMDAIKNPFIKKDKRDKKTASKKKKKQ